MAPDIAGLHMRVGSVRDEPHYLSPQVVLTYQLPI